MDWVKKQGKLTKEFKKQDFSAVMEFVNKVAELANELNHHPDICIHDYNQVRISTVTHDADSTTQKDRELAQKIDQLADEKSS